MKNVSNAFKAKMNERTDFYSTAEITFADGTVKTLTKSDFINQGNTVVQGVSSGSFPLGILSSKQISLSLLNNDDKWEEYGFYNAKIMLFTNYQTNDEPVWEEDKKDFVPIIEKIQEGIFTVISPESYGSTIQISAMDESYKADREYTSTLLFPARLDDVLRDVCGTCEISLHSDDIPNKDYIVKEKPSGGTCREIIGYCAMIAGGNAIIDNYNRLKIITYNFSAFSDETKSKSIPVLSSFKTGMSIEAIDVEITGVQISGKVETTDSDGNITSKDKLFKYGEEGYVLTLRNTLAEGNEEAFLKAVGDSIIGLKFRAFSGDSIANPLLEFMDCVYIRDYKGRQFQTVLTYVDFTYFGITVLKCSADSPLRNGKSSGGNNVQQIKQLIEKERTERERALKRLSEMISNSGGGLFLTEEQLEDQSKIFYAHDKPTLAESKNIIKVTSAAIGFSTDGGETYPFVLSYDGETILRQIYAIGIDANYIKTGHITADRIRGGTMTLGGLNNENGALYILNSNGEVVGTLDNKGIHTKEGVFEGALKAATGTFAGNLQAAGGTFNGDLQAAGGTFYGDLYAAGGTFNGNLHAAGGTFSGDLSAAGGTFTGNLSAAGGTFNGDLQAAGGTFAGELRAAKGTFAGNLEAAGGTFSGELSAAKGSFMGKVQSGDLSKYGVEISEGVLKGYRKNTVVAYVDTNNDVEIDGVVSPGMRIASKGGIVLRSPYLCVAKDYLDPDVHGEMLLGGNGSFNAVTSFETTGEGEDRKLVLQYKHLDFTNGIMTSNLQGGSNIVDYPEQPNPPQTDNTYQEEIEKAYADVVNDLSAENMGELSKRFFSSNIYGPTPKGEYGISGWNTDYKSGRMIIAPSTTVGVVRTTVDNIDWLPAYGFDCNPYIEGVPNSERWYGRKLLKDCGLTRNFMWPLLNTMVSNYGYVNSNMYISFFVVGYAGDSWYVSDIMRGDSSAMLANTTYGQWDLVINGNTTLTSILWWHGSPPHHACANAGRFGNSHGGSQASSILPSWFEPSDLKNYWPSVFSTINSFLVDKGMPGASDSYIAKSIMGWSASYDGKNDIYMDNLFNAPIGVQIFNINNVPHYTLGTAWKNDNYIYYYDNLIPDDHYSNANSTITNARPLVLPITKLSANLSHARIYATYDCANPSYFHEGLKRLKLMRGEFLALK